MTSHHSGSVASDSDPMPDARTSTRPVVYWRPGCGFCAALLRGLERESLDFDRANIWEDEEAAAFVRSVASGNETVPTVQVGDHALVNPTRQEVLAAVADQTPEHLPEGYEPPEPGIVEKVLRRVLG